MANTIGIAKYYYELSNLSNFDEIEKLFTEDTTYCSENTWIFLWVEQIIIMQKIFHSGYQKLTWTINTIEEIDKWIVLIDFNFVWIKNDWEEVSWSWLEHVVVNKWKIQHIKIDNK